MACYLPSPRQLGFANQIIFNQTPTPPLVAPSHAAWGFAALGKAGFDIPAGPIPLLLKFRLPMGVSSFPGILIWLMNHPPFLWCLGGSGLGCSLPRDRFVQPWVKPKLGGVVATGDPLTWSPPSMFCSAAPNPSWCTSHIYGLPPTSGLGKAAFPGVSIDVPAPGSGCCPG